ncbi:MAG: RiPP maturation radical SAM protein 1 [Desulfobacterales bacterium]|nr:RiPP maturation radical SAM protein 1 [Desulfobacterales bacterium]
MYRVALINIPFATLNFPSIGLTQLRYRIIRELEEQVSADILYLNHDFAHYLGLNYCKAIAGTRELLKSGFGDWFFRQAAFPETRDNTQDYMQRYFRHADKQTAMIVDAALEKREGLKQFIETLIDKYQLDRADIVGFTSMFFKTPAFAIARILKQRNPGIVTVMGGSNCLWPMGAEIVQHIPSIDFVFSGPALKNFPIFIGHCLDKDMEKCSQISGVLSKTNCQNPPAFMGEELSINTDVELDYDAFLDTIEKNFPNGEVKPMLILETSRGCWWGERMQCTFCGANGRSLKYEAMSSEKAIRLFQSLFAYWPRVSRIEVTDNSMPVNYLKEVFPLLNPPPGMTIFYEVKLGETMTEEAMQTLSNAGVKDIQPGIESLSTSTLKLIRKGTTAFQNLIFLKNCLLYDICPQWNFLIGFPGEDEAVYRKYLADLPLMTHLPPPTIVAPVHFLRFSVYHVRADEYGLDLRPWDCYSFIYPFDADSLNNFAYFFEDHNVHAPYRTNITKWMDRMREKTEYWIERWRNGHDSVFPQLYFKGEGEPGKIYDSRSEQAVEYQVGEVGQRILDYLKVPRRIADISSALNDIPNFDPERELALLRRHGLIFQERNRFLSLVLPHENEALKLIWMPETS